MKSTYHNYVFELNTETHIYFVLALLVADILLLIFQMEWITTTIVIYLKIC